MSKGREKGTKRPKQTEQSPLGKTRRALEGRQRLLPRPRGRGVRPSSHRIQRPTLLNPDHYLVEMRVPGDIVSTLLQGHWARRTRLGVAALGKNGGCLAPEGAAGHAWQGGQPRASNQRGAHGPGADLELGRDQGQGCPLAKPGPARRQSAGPESGLGEAGGSRWVQDASLGPSSEATCSALGCRCSKPHPAPSKAKASSESRSPCVWMTARAIPAPILENG